MKKLKPWQKPEYGIKKIFPIFARQCKRCKHYYKFTKIWRYLYTESSRFEMPETFTDRNRHDYEWSVYICFDCASSLADVIRYREGGRVTHREPTITPNTPVPEFEENTP